jgi:hypothetical protein
MVKYIYVNLYILYIRRKLRDFKLILIRNMFLLDKFPEITFSVKPAEMKGGKGQSLLT